MPIKLCRTALRIKARYETGAGKSDTEPAEYNDKRAKARALNRHMSYCRECG